MGTTRSRKIAIEKLPEVTLIGSNTSIRGGDHHSGRQF